MKLAPQKFTSILLALLCVISFALSFVVVPALMVGADYRDTADRLAGNEVSDIYISERVMESARSNADVMLCTSAAVAFFIVALVLFVFRAPLKLMGLRPFNPLLIIFGALGAIGLRGIIDLITGYLFTQTGAIMAAVSGKSATALKLLTALALPLAFELLLHGAVYGYVSRLGRGAAVAVSALLNAAAMYALFSALALLVEGSADAGIGALIVGALTGGVLSIVRLKTGSLLLTAIIGICISFSGFILEPIWAINSSIYLIISVVAALVGIGGIFAAIPMLTKRAPKPKAGRKAAD